MKFLSISFLALAVASTAVQADLDVAISGQVKFKFSDVSNNVVGTTSDATFSTKSDVNFNVTGAHENLTYGAIVEFDSESTALTLDKTEIWVVTPFGRFGAGEVPTTNRSADVIAAGEAGVSTDPLGREYEEKFGGPAVSYGIKMGGFGAGVSVNAELEPSWTVIYGGETSGDGSYEVFTRGTDRGEVKSEIAGAVRTAATSYKAMQHGAKVKFGDISVAGSFGNDKATDYAFLTTLGANTILNDNVERDYWNVGVRYDMGALSVSADYDEGTINAPWVAAPSITSTVANRASAYSNADYDSWSVGMEYKIADGLKFGAGYKRVNQRVELLLEAAGLATGGFKLKDQSEVAAAISLNF